MSYGKGKEPSLRGKGGRDASSYKSETGGMAGGKKMDKLAAQGGAKGKDASQYSESNVNGARKAGA
jgi:hypothetical protein